MKLYTHKAKKEQGIYPYSTSSADLPARTGDHVKFALDAEKIHVFDKETQVTITN